MEKGTRVRVIRKNGPIEEGTIGTYKGCNGDDLAIEFDMFICGHTCDGFCKDGYGYWLLKDHLEIIPTNKRPITYNAPDWFTWGYEHDCLVWDDDDKKEDIIIAIDGGGYFINKDGFFWKHAKPITPEPEIVQITVRKDDLDKLQDYINKAKETDNGRTRFTWGSEQDYF